MYPDPEVQRSAIARMARMRAGHDIKEEEWVICTKGGEKRTLAISTTVLKEEQGRIHVLAIMEDITGQKLAEEALRKSEEHYRLLAEHTADVIYRVRLEDEKYTYASPSAESCWVC
jgi:PAS domain-containing protein